MYKLNQKGIKYLLSAVANPVYHPATLRIVTACSDRSKGCERAMRRGMPRNVLESDPLGMHQETNGGLRKRGDLSDLFERTDAADT